jgi:transposase-like protein
MTHRRQFTAEVTAQVVLELLSRAKSRAEVCREHQLATSVWAEWKAIFLRHAPTAFESSEHCSGQEAPQVVELERLVERVTLENDSLKTAASIVHQRSRPSRR